MHYSIQYHVQDYPHLNITPRKPSLKHLLLSVVHGLALARIGKTEYVISPDDYFWIPANCLSSVTVVPHSRIACAEISQRTAGEFPPNAGYVTPEPIIQNTFGKLAQPEIQEDYRNALLKVIQFESQCLNPQLLKGGLTKKVNAWKPSAPQGLEDKLHHSLLIREARRRLLSGNKKESVVAALFKADSDEFDQMYKEMFGDRI